MGPAFLALDNILESVYNVCDRFFGFVIKEVFVWINLMFLNLM